MNDLKMEKWMEKSICAQLKEKKNEMERTCIKQFKNGTHHHKVWFKIHLTSKLNQDAVEYIDRHYGRDVMVNEIENYELKNRLLEYISNNNISKLFDEVFNKATYIYGKFSAEKLKKRVEPGIFKSESYAEIDGCIVFSLKKSFIKIQQLDVDEKSIYERLITNKDIISWTEIINSKKDSKLVINENGLILGDLQIDFAEKGYEKMTRLQMEMLALVFYLNTEYDCYEPIFYVDRDAYYHFEGCKLSKYVQDSKKEQEIKMKSW